ncbi:MAG: class I SAM-dependent methyltransferase [Anaerolineae bacterium]|nr:class I SAM-dependent methyltransferase [Anaerolineae bacterium]
MFTRLKHWWRFNRMYLAGRTPWDSGISPPELHEFVQTHPAGRALDLGCGTGTNAIFLAQQGWRVVAIDFAIKAITAARQKAKRAGAQIDFRIGDVVSAANGGPYDLILDLGCFHGLDAAKRAAYATNVKRLLSPQGTFLLYAHFKLPNRISTTGIDIQDLTIFLPELQLQQRRDGIDTARPSPSAWLTYCFAGKKFG